MMDRPTCKTCPCFELHDDGEETVGNCQPNDESFIAMHDPAREDGWCASHPEFAEWVESVNKKEVKNPCKTCGRECEIVPSETMMFRARLVCPLGHPNRWIDIVPGVAGALDQIGPAVWIS